VVAAHVLDADSDLAEVEVELVLEHDVRRRDPGLPR